MYVAPTGFIALLKLIEKRKRSCIAKFLQNRFCGLGWTSESVYLVGMHRISWIEANEQINLWLQTVNPRKFLKQLTGKEISVKLKWGMEYKGILVSSDRYFNLQMANTEEFVDGQSTGNLGEVLIRCNNVLYMRASE